MQQNRSKNGKNVALLSTGDPGFSGLLHTVLESGLVQGCRDINVVPGVSSIQACAARLNISWDNTRLFTFHDTVSDDEKEKLVSAVKCGRTILLLPNSRGFAPKDIASLSDRVGYRQGNARLHLRKHNPGKRKDYPKHFREGFWADFWLVMRNGYQANR